MSYDRVENTESDMPRNEKKLSEPTEEERTILLSRIKDLEEMKQDGRKKLKEINAWFRAENVDFTERQNLIKQRGALLDKDDWYLAEQGHIAGILGYKDVFGYIEALNEARRSSVKKRGE